MTKPWLLLSLLCAGLMISSCASPRASERQIPTAVIDAKAACLAWPVVSFSRLHDTVETIKSAKEANAAREGFCGV